MQESSGLPELRARLGRIIASTCNAVGCRDCSLKWDGGCSATELQDQILDIEMKDFNHTAPEEAQ